MLLYIYIFICFFIYLYVYIYLFISQKLRIPKYLMAIHKYILFVYYRPINPIYSQVLRHTITIYIFHQTHAQAIHDVKTMTSRLQYRASYINKQGNRAFLIL